MSYDTGHCQPVHCVYLVNGLIDIRLSISRSVDVVFYVRTPYPVLPPDLCRVHVVTVFPLFSRPLMTGTTGRQTLRYTPRQFRRPSVSLISPYFDLWSDRSKSRPLGEPVPFPTHLLSGDSLSVKGIPGDVLTFALLGGPEGRRTVEGRPDSVSRQSYKKYPLRKLRFP